MCRVIFEMAFMEFFSGCLLAGHGNGGRRTLVKGGGNEDESRRALLHQPLHLTPAGEVSSESVLTLTCTDMMMILGEIKVALFFLLPPPVFVSYARNVTFLTYLIPDLVGTTTAKYDTASLKLVPNVLLLLSK